MDGSLEIGGWVVDTPGIRVFRLYDVKKPVVFTLYKTFSKDGGLTWRLGAGN